ncbi:MAG: DNA primase [Ruminococcus sp.]|nr:DNA primase [Ruminococcus sp.]
MEEKGKINEPLFCKAFTESYPLIFSGNRFYTVDGEISEDVISHSISEKVMPYVKNNIAAVVKRLTEALKLYCFSEPIVPKEDEIHLLNGVLKTDGTWIPEKNFCVNRLNITYDPNIWDGEYYPVEFMSFLMDMLDMDDIATLQEYLGYCLIPSTKGQAMLFIIGNGGEGKSRIGIVLQEIFKSAMLTGSFQRIETDKFFRYNLQNKLLMLDDDMQMSALPSTGYIKNLVTAEIPIDVEAKGQQSQQAMLYSRFLCFGNGSPKTLYDKSDGFSRRLIILTTKPVPENRYNDPFLADKFIAEKEKIFYWMLDGLLRLIRNNFRFTLSAKTKQNISEVMTENCNIIEFLSDKSYVTFDSDIQTSSTELYGGYFHWCSENAITALKQDTFISWLKSNEKRYNIKYTYHVPNRNGGHVRGFKGIKTKWKPILI